MTKQQYNSKAGTAKNALPLFFMKRITEGGFILVLSFAVFLLLSLSSYEPNDPGWFAAHSTQGTAANAGGQVGAYLADILYYFFGYFSFILPLCAAYVAQLILRIPQASTPVNSYGLSLRLSGLLFLMIAGCSLLSLNAVRMGREHELIGGGTLGNFVAGGFDYAFNLQGALLSLVAILLAGITCFTGLSWMNVLEYVGDYTLRALGWQLQKVKQLITFIHGEADEEEDSTPVEKKPLIREPKVAKKEKATPMLMAENVPPAPPVLTPAIETAPVPIAREEAAPVKAAVSKERPAKKFEGSTTLPPVSLLDKGQPGKPLGGYTHQELESVSREVEQHLLDFGIQADVVAVHPGPVITRFELQLAAGIKVSKLSALSKDLARSLSVTSVRVVEVIPGKTVVGLELPNQHREMVRLYEVLSADVYQQAHSPLSMALGVDIAGYPMVVDLAKMPHLLVAGTTGSGKSVGINAMILSLLFKATPEQVRLILIDPKMLELSVYDGIPHLLTPVVTDMKEAASALRWCVGEMERRYRLMSALGVRNLAGYNTMVSEAEARGEPLADPLWKPVSSMDLEAPSLKTLPFVVVIIDELADMMMVVGKKVEQLIARIAQKARAAGIHLILATQRPSVDVLTGLIKSNIPTRMSFQVSSKIDSRTILDQQGAEQLLGHGDLLYLAPGSGAPLRVHGAFVDDKEVHRIADDWRARGEPEYIDEITQTFDPQEGGGYGEDGQDTEDTDPLYDQAVEFVIQTRKSSISAVQRRLKIGYNRAARLVEEMERTGVVGPLDGGCRDVLVKTESED